MVMAQLQSNTFNPYATLESEARVEEVAKTEDEVIRYKYLKREAGIQAMARVYMAFAILVGLYCIPLLIMMIYQSITFPADVSTRLRSELFTILFGLLTGIAIAIAQAIVSFRLQRLMPSTRWDGTLMCVLSMMVFPPGTLIGGFTLYLMWTSKGRLVLSKEYERIRAATPHIRYYTATWVWIAIAIAITLLVGLMVAAFLV
jgi:hypothetical protein